MASRAYQRFEVWLLDECPRIGCGRRIVEANVGWKWVRLRLPQGYPVKASTRILRSKWEELVRRH